MTNSVAGLILLVIAVAAFNNYQRGTLRQWLEAKFLNAAAPAAEGQALVTLDTPGAAAAAGAIGAAGAAAAAGADGLDLVTVGGITLARSAAASYAAMAAAARADGVPLSGSGYRSNARQVALRGINGCKGREYDRSCRGNPPTAIPGSSLHEKGLAIDFNNAKTRDTAVYRWLAANAERYGWKNLPSEPWHWSTGPRAGS